MKKLSEQIGRCLTKVWREDFESAAAEQQMFISQQQNVPEPKSPEEAYALCFTRPLSYKLLPKPEFRAGEILWGVRLTQGQRGLTWLGCIEDSSD